MPLPMLPRAGPDERNAEQAILGQPGMAGYEPPPRGACITQPLQSLLHLYSTQLAGGLLLFADAERGPATSQGTTR